MMDVSYHENACKIVKAHASPVLSLRVAALG